MEARADRFSEVEVLRRRAYRFEEEVASELVQPREAERKNQRFRRFKEEEEEGVEVADDELGEEGRRLAGLKLQ